LTHTDRDISTIKDWPAGIAQLLDEARTDVEQLLGHGRIVRADELTRASGMTFDATYNPMYFTGAFESAIVLVHLNPKLSPQLANYPYLDFNEYCEKHRKFGLFHLGMNPSYRSPFDLKQVRFLRPFNEIEFRPDTEVGHSRTNAAMAIDSKLQLELFNSVRITNLRDCKIFNDRSRASFRSCPCRNQCLSAQIRALLWRRI
jgi:hypothetical protein